jgi:energy-coupling factor transporter ATP-binding protein EcfA2
MYPRGSEWRMWDLHVHTPASIVSHFRGQDPWDQYLSDLAALPSSLKVLGINDYWFLDGYERVKREFDSGRFPNLDAIFPVIEVRCDTFGGVDGKLRRINMHFICDPLLALDEIKTQLLVAFKKRLVLGAGSESEWREIVTRASLERLGQTIKASVPEDRRADYASDLIEGFNNVCVNFDAAVEHVRQHSLLSKHVLIGVGKTEWAAIKWNDQSIATKRNLLTNADLIFTASGDRDEYYRSLSALRDANLNSRLLDCSDAHYNLDHTNKDRLGNSFTWINADPTFKGLKHALREFGHRVTVDSRPAVLERTAQRPASVIDSIIIDRSGVDVEPEAGPGWFDVRVPINPAFAVILGNKGQGKSALLDTIAATANSDRDNDYSFLASTRFRRQGGRTARQYAANLLWLDGHENRVTLDQRHQPGLPVQVDYLPQALIEKVCSSDPDSIEGKHFEAEIERVVFRHLPDSQRGGFTSLQQYVSRKSQSANNKLASARAKIGDATKDLSALETRAMELAQMDLDQRLSTLRQAVANVEDALAIETFNLETAKLASASPEANEIAQRLQASTEARDSLRVQIDAARLALSEEEAELGDARVAYEQLLVTVRLATEQADALSAIVGVPRENLFVANVMADEWSRWETAQESTIVAGRVRLDDPETGLIARASLEESAISVLSRQLGEFDRSLATITTRIADLGQQKLLLVGDSAKPDTVVGVEALVAEREGIPERVNETQMTIRLHFLDAHSAAMSIFAIRREAYSAASDFVANNDLAKQVELEFGVELWVENFIGSWAELVNRQKLSQMPDGFEDGNDAVLIGDTSLADAEALFERLRWIEGRLRTDRGASTCPGRPLSSVMRAHNSPASLLSVLYSLAWLEGRYVIRSGGAELSEL